MSEQLRNDVDPGETREWLDALESLLREEGPERARFIIDQLAEQARKAGVELSVGGRGGQILTDYINSIATSDEPAYPGDKELERRGHCFVRYAGDCNVYVHSRRAGERVMAQLRRLYARLRLRINEAKSRVSSVFAGRKFLGYSFWVAPKGEIKRTVAKKALEAFKQRVRQLSRRSCGRSLQQVVERLSSYLEGWKGYYRLAQTSRVWQMLDEWLRHRLRAIQLKQWKQGKTMFRELRALGASRTVAQRVAANSRRWWCNSGKLLNRVLNLAWFDRLGLARLS